MYEGYTFQDLCTLSGHSFSKIRSICYAWLKQTPPGPSDLAGVHTVVYDGTYFHQEGCLMILMQAPQQLIVDSTYGFREGFHHVFPWLTRLKARGFNPRAVTMDGEQSTLRAFQTVWPTIRIQRCLYHIQREGLRWLRTHPPTRAGRALKKLLLKVCSIRSVKEQKHFIRHFRSWQQRYQTFVDALPRCPKVHHDLKRTVSLIQHALPDMFHHLADPDIRATSNALESFYSRLKQAYRQHRGLSQRHKIQFLRWYCYYENQQKINNL